MRGVDGIAIVISEREYLEIVGKARKRVKAFVVFGRSILVCTY